MSSHLDSSPGTEMFANYESDFQLAYQEISQKLQDLPDLPTSEERKASVQAIKRAIDEANEIIDQLAIEVQNIPSSERAQFNSKLRKYRGDLDKAKRDTKEADESSSRRALFGDRGANEGSDIALDQRQQLLSGTASLERSSQRLRDSQRVANETEAVGANILTDLRGQREQIVNSRNTLMEADGFVDKSIRTLRGMSRRMAMNRIITVAIITVLIILILLVIASKFW